VLESKRHCASVIQQCIDEGLFPGATDPAAVFRVLSTAVYGAAVFRLTNRLPPGEDAEALAKDVLDTTLAGLRAGARLTLTTSGCPVSDTANADPARPGGRTVDTAERAFR
jgi:hypothetical protein